MAISVCAGEAIPKQFAYEISASSQSVFPHLLLLAISFEECFTGKQYAAPTRLEDGGS